MVRGAWCVVHGPWCGEQSGVANSLKTPRSPRIVSLRLIDLLQLHHDLSAGQAEEPKKWVLCPRILSWIPAFAGMTEWGIPATGSASYPILGFQ